MSKRMCPDRWLMWGEHAASMTWEQKVLIDWCHLSCLEANWYFMAIGNPLFQGWGLNSILTASLLLDNDCLNIAAPVCAGDGQRDAFPGLRRFRQWRQRV